MAAWGDEGWGAWAEGDLGDRDGHEIGDIESDRVVAAGGGWADGVDHDGAEPVGRDDGVDVADEGFTVFSAEAVEVDDVGEGDGGWVGGVADAVDALGAVGWGGAEGADGVGGAPD